MLVSTVFIIIVFNVLSLLCFFISKESPKGSFKSWDYSRIPGIMTANTLSSREAWKAAHRSTSFYFMLLAVYFALGSVVNLVVLWARVDVNSEVVFTVTIMLGIGMFLGLVIMGDRVASRIK